MPSSCCAGGRVLLAFALGQVLLAAHAARVKRSAARQKKNPGRSGPSTEPGSVADVLTPAENAYTAVLRTNSFIVAELMNRETEPEVAQPGVEERPSTSSDHDDHDKSASMPVAVAVSSSSASASTSRRDSYSSSTSVRSGGPFLESPSPSPTPTEFCGYTNDVRVPTNIKAGSCSRSSSPQPRPPRPAVIAASRAFVLPEIRNWEEIPAEARMDPDVVAQALLRGWLSDAEWQQLPDVFREQLLPRAVVAAVRTAGSQGVTGEAFKDMVRRWRSLQSSHPQLRESLLRDPDFVAAALKSFGMNRNGLFRSVAEVEAALALDPSVLRAHPAVVAELIHQQQETGLTCFGIANWERDVSDAAKNDPDVVAAALEFELPDLFYPEMVRPRSPSSETLNSDSDDDHSTSLPRHLPGLLITDPAAQVPWHLWQHPDVVYALLTAPGYGAHGLKYGGRELEDYTGSGTEDEEDQLASQMTHCQHIGWVSSWEDVPIEIRGDIEVAQTGIVCGWVTDFLGQVLEPAKTSAKLVWLARNNAVLRAHGDGGGSARAEVDAGSEMRNLQGAVGEEDEGHHVDFDYELEEGGAGLGECHYYSGDNAMGRALSDEVEEEEDSADASDAPCAGYAQEEREEQLVGAPWRVWYTNTPELLRPPSDHIIAAAQAHPYVTAIEAAFTHSVVGLLRDGTPVYRF